MRANVFVSSSRGVALSARPARRALKVQANTLWSLAPKVKTAKIKDVDLTGAIGAHKMCSVSAADYAEKSSEAVDLTIVDHGGVHVLFEAEGTARPLDSPSILFLTDIDSMCDIKVDGTPVKKGERFKLRPGCTVEMGPEVQYTVHRNVQAHA